MKTACIASLLALVATLSHAVSVPADIPTAPTAGGAVAAPIPFSEIGAKASADYQGNAIGVEATPQGASLHTGFQKLAGRVTVRGLCVDSTEGEGSSLRLAAAALGRVGAEALRLADTGTVALTEKTVTWSRPGLVEEYSVSVDGVRQDFIVAQPPAGTGDLSVELALSGACAEMQGDGVQLTFAGSGRKLAYSRLHVTDAAGRELAARLEVLAADRLAVRVDDAGAVYPVRIDPTFSDADWTSMNPYISGVSGSVSALAVDGSGALYIGGDFTTAGGVSANNIAKWNGSAWSALGSGINGKVFALAVSGSDVYAAASANYIAKWNGSAWSALGSGISGSVRALAVSGGDVYAGGSFSTAGGVSANSIARWNGSEWSALGSGMNGNVSALAVSGSDVYAGGSFSTAGGVSANSIARWNGSEWSALGSGMNGNVSALAVSGSNVYVGGDFTEAGGVVANNIAKWDGSAWSALGSGINVEGYVNALAVSGSDVYAGGYFTKAGGVSVNNIAKWNGSAWLALGSGMNLGVRMNSSVGPLAASGGDVYAGGDFTTAGGVAASRIAKWNGGAWSALGSGINGINGSVEALAVDGRGVLYIGGDFTTAGGVSASRIAKWNGSAWSALGSGISGSVRALAVDGSGVLYAGGGFATADGVATNYIAKWNGSGWSALGSGMNKSVRALAVDDSGVLFAGGDFTTAGGVSANYIAKWNGSAWSALGSGVNYMYGFVNALAVSGSDVYAGGKFTTAGGVTAYNVAKWNGSAWSALGSGIINAYVVALAVSGNDVYAGGDFTTAGGVSANYIAKWNGSAWSALGSGMNGYVRALAVDGSGGIYAGGDFTAAGGVSASRIAKWNGSAWSALGSGMSGYVGGLTTSGDYLYAGGVFGTVGTKVSPFLAKANIGPQPPIITSADIASGKVGQSFIYQITTSTSPTSYGAVGLPFGLSLDTGTGLISGTLVTAGTYYVTISATNAKGTGIMTLKLTTVMPPPPYGRFIPRSQTFVESPCHLNAIFQLVDETGRGINYPRLLLEARKDLFYVMEDGVSVSPSESFMQISKLDEVPAKLRTVLLLDNSFSVGSNLGTIKTSAKALVDRMTAQQEIAVYCFSGGSPVMLSDFKGRGEQGNIKAAIDGMTLGSPSTNLYGAVIEMLNLPKWVESYSLNGIETGFLVVLTDGADTSGLATLGQVISRRDQLGKAIYAIGLGKEINPSALDDLQNTGGYLDVVDVSQLQAAFQTIQDKIEDAANSFYWLNYASPKRGNFNRTLTVSLRDNINVNSDRILTRTFNSNGFTDVLPGVMINRAANTSAGVTKIQIAKDAKAAANAFTMLGFLGTPVYTWSLANPGLATLTPLDEDGNHVEIAAKSLDGTTELTLTDTVNGYSKTIDLVIGTGVALPSQTLAFTAPADCLATSAPFRLTATASSGLAPVFSIVSGPAVLGGDGVTVSLTGAGLVTVRASQPGNASFAAAPDVVRTFTVTKASQTISFDRLGDRKISSPAFALVASTNAANLSVNFTVSGPASLAADGKTLSLSGATGIVTVTAAQNGDAFHAAAVPVVRSFSVTVNGPVETSLASLELPGIPLSPQFAPEILDYTAATTASSLVLKAAPLTATSTLKLNGNALAAGVESAPVPLVIGANKLTVTVTAPGGAASVDYAIVLTRIVSNNAMLKALVVSGASLSPAFASTTTAYTAAVANTVSTVSIKPTADHPAATIKVNGVGVSSGKASGNIALIVGSNVVNVEVTAQNRVTIRKYTLTITRAKSSDASLSSLALSTGSLSPAFSKSVLSYTASVAKTVSSIKVKASASHAAAVIRINGTVVKSGVLSNAISLVVGKNTIRVAVTAQNGTIRTYTIVVTRGSLSAPLSAWAPTVEAVTATTAPVGRTRISNVWLSGKTYRQLTIEYPAGSPAPRVEVSGDLVRWSSGPRHTTVVDQSPGRVTVRDNTPFSSGAKRFIRVRKGLDVR